MAKASYFIDCQAEPTTDDVATETIDNDKDATEAIDIDEVATETIENNEVAMEAIPAGKDTLASYPLLLDVNISADYENRATDYGIIGT